MEENELYHHGVVGMKWGVRRYQNKDGSLTAEGKKHYGDGTDPKRARTLTLKVGSKSTRDAKKAAAEKERKKKEAAKAKQTEVDKEKLKADIIAKGDYRKALDNIEMFSNAELKNLVDRRTQMESLSAFKAREKTNIRKGAEKVTAVLNTIGNLTSAGIKAYNNTADIHNFLFKDNDEWGKIGKGDGNKKKNKNKDDDDDD